MQVENDVVLEDFLDSGQNVLCLCDDCMQVMHHIPDRSIDMILCDLPYGTIDCEWDKRIPYESLWREYNRIIKDNRVIALFGSEPFSSYLRMSNIDGYKYDWIWAKDNCTGFQHAKNMPLKDYEIISVFSKGSMGHQSLLGEKRMIYNPQGLIHTSPHKCRGTRENYTIIGQRLSHKKFYFAEYENYPKMILKYKKDVQSFHPTQKPVALLEYLIKTYTFPNDVVLDNCMGSGSTMVVCINTERRGIGIEIDRGYYDIARSRCDLAEKEPSLWK